MPSDRFWDNPDDNQILEAVTVGLNESPSRGWIWTSPNLVSHFVHDNGRCATCGRHHESN